MKATITNKLQRILAALLTVVLLMTLLPELSLPASAVDFSGGMGFQSNPYLITTPEQLDAVRGYCGEEYKNTWFALDADIDLTAYLAPGGAGYAKWKDGGWLPIGDNPDNIFYGNFSGNGHKITGLWANRKYTAYVGLFGYLKGALIERLTVDASSNWGMIGGAAVGVIAGYANEQSFIRYCNASGSVAINLTVELALVGGLVGYANQSYIYYCTSSVSVENSKVVTTTEDNMGLVFVAANGCTGGIAGAATESVIYDCRSTGRVNGYHFVGGIVGRMKNNTTVSTCTNTGKVTVSRDPAAMMFYGYYPNYIGGIAGGIDIGGVNYVKDCVNTGEIGGNCIRVGGIVGGTNMSENPITGCINTGTVRGEIYVGGISGTAFSVRECFNTGRVTGNGSLRVGGIMGDITTGAVVEYCYNVGQVSGVQYIGGVAGIVHGTVNRCYSSADVSGTEWVGNLAGLAQYCTITNSYWNTDKSTTSVNTPSNRGIGDADSNIENYTKSTITNVYGRNTNEFVHANAIKNTNQTGYLRFLVDWSQESGSDPANSPWTKRSDLSACCGTEKFFPELKCFVNSANPFIKALSISSAAGVNPSSVAADEDVFVGGSGTSADPYRIYTAGQLNHVRRHAGAYFVLMTDLDLNGFSDGAGWKPIESFSGFFDGNGHTISGLVIRRGETDGVGLFSRVEVGATVFNLTVIATEINGRSNVGGIAGVNNGTIQFCSFTGPVYASEYCAGGIVGFNSGGTVESCTHESGNVFSQNGNAGGIAGQNTNGVIYSSVNQGGSIYSYGSDAAIGGIVGTTDGSGRIWNCFNYSRDVNGNYKLDVSNSVGGIAGINWNTVDDCHNYGAALGSTNTGGVVGLNYGTVIYCVNEPAGVVEGRRGSVGGVVGYNEGYNVTGSVFGCYNNGSVFASGESVKYSVGGIVGNNHCGSIDTCENNGSVKGYGTPSGDSVVGGISGITEGNQIPYNATIANCVSTGEIVCNGGRVGGVSGYLGSALVKDSRNEGAVSGKSEVGGIFGYGGDSNVSDCCNTGAVSGTGSNVGGIGGWSVLFISRCYNTGAVSANERPGGIVGYNQQYAWVSESFNYGAVSGTYSVGGLVGGNDGTLVYSYNTGAIRTSSATADGLVGSGFDNGYVAVCYAACTVNGVAQRTGGLSVYQATDDDGALDALDLSNNYVKRSNTDEWYYPELTAFYADNPTTPAQITSRLSVTVEPEQYKPTLTISGAKQPNNDWVLTITLSGASNNAGQPVHLGISDGSGTRYEDNLTTDATGVIVYTMAGYPLGGDYYYAEAAFTASGPNAAASVNTSCAYTKDSQDFSVSSPVSYPKVGMDPFAMSVTETVVSTGARTWRSTNENVATVDSSGNVTITGLGTATIYLKIDFDDSYNDKEAGCQINVTQQELSISLPAGFSKTYDGTSAADYDPQEVTLSGLRAGHDVFVTAVTASFADSEVGTGKTITAANIEIGGADAGYYSLPEDEVTQTGDIAPRPVTVTPDAGQIKYYGDADPVLTYQYSLSAVQGEAPAFSGALAGADGEAVGEHAISLGTLALRDNEMFKASNYELVFDNTVVFMIEKRPLSGAAIVLSETLFYYTGSEIEPDVSSVTLGGATVDASEYDVSYSDNLDAGTATVTVTAKPDGHYSGSEDTTFLIVKNSDPAADAEAPDIDMHPQDAVYRVNDTATALSVSAGVSDGGTLSYQWYSSATDSTTGGNPVGTDSASFTPPTSELGTVYYYVVVTNTNDSVSGTKTASATSDAAEVMVLSETPINIAAIDGVTPPLAGAVPVTAVTETAQYTGTVTWEPEVSGTFAENTVYTATITLTPKAGYTLTGVTADFFTVADAMAANAAYSGVVTAIFPETTEIVNTQTPTITTQPQDASYSVNDTATALSVAADVSDGGTLSYQWYSNTTDSTTGGNPVGTNSASFTPPTSELGTVYYYVVVTNTNDSVGGTKTADVTSDIAAVTVSEARIDIAAIDGVVAPSAGAVPVTTVTETAQYTGTVTWDPTVSDTFENGTVYTATITLTAKANYTLTGVTEDFFTVAGATTVRNDENSGVVTAVFPETTNAPTYTALISPTAGTFPAAVLGYGTRTAQVFTITNTGNQTLTNLTAALGGSDYEISAAISPVSIAPGQTAEVSVRPVTGLAAATYTDTLTVSGDDVSLTAGLSFTVNAPTGYTITFNANGGTASATAVQTGADGKLASLPTATRSGRYSFDGWFTEASGGTKITEDTAFAENTTIYAHWTYTGGSGGGGVTSYVVTFNTNGGSTVSSQSVTLGGKAVKPADPTRGGFNFVGWFKDAALTQAYDFNASVTSSFTLYAKWDVADREKPVSFPFIDVHEGDWFYENVYYVWLEGLMNGTAADTFSPHMSLTRGMIVTILYRHAGEPSVAGLANPFADVAAGQYYTDAVIWAAANGIVGGYGDGNYGPNAPITRQDLAVILMRYASFAGLKLPVTRDYPGFKDDADVADYAKEAIEAFFKAGIISGRDNGTFDPQGTATRAEVAAMLHRFLELIK